MTGIDNGGNAVPGARAPVTEYVHVSACPVIDPALRIHLSCLREALSRLRHPSHPAQELDAAPELYDHEGVLLNRPSSETHTTLGLRSLRPPAAPSYPSVPWEEPGEAAPRWNLTEALTSDVLIARWGGRESSRAAA